MYQNQDDYIDANGIPSASLKPSPNPTALDKSVDKKELRGNFLLRQELKNLTPTCTPFKSMLINLVIFLLFIIFSIPIMRSSSDTFQFMINYDDCSTAICQYMFKVDSRNNVTFYLYYKLDNYYANYRELARSRSWMQLRDKRNSKEEYDDTKLLYSDLNLCKGALYIYEVFGNSSAVSIDGTRLRNDSIANPCGYKAKNFFNDTYKLYYVNRSRLEESDFSINLRLEDLFSLIPSENEPTYSSMIQKSLKNKNKNMTILKIDPLFNQTELRKFQKVLINETGISIESYKELFIRHPHYRKVQWIDVEDGILFNLEHFIVWMELNVLPSFFKKWGRIVEGLDEGYYILEINNSK